jgi:flagellar protein FlbD
LLTRLDKSKVLINLEAIKYAEATPDTLISFLNGDSIMVRESLEELEQRVINYKTKILSSDPSPDLYIHHQDTPPSR